MIREEVYINAITLMKDLAAKPWEQLILRQIIRACPHEEVRLYPSAQGMVGAQAPGETRCSSSL